MLKDIQANTLWVMSNIRREGGAVSIKKVNIQNQFFRLKGVFQLDDIRWRRPYLTSWLVFWYISNLPSKKILFNPMGNNRLEINHFGHSLEINHNCDIY